MEGASAFPSEVGSLKREPYYQGHPMVQSRDKGGRGIPNICKESLLLHTFIPFFEASSTIKLTIFIDTNVSFTILSFFF